MSEQPTTITTTRITRTGGSESYSGGSSRLKDIAFTLGSIAVGALAGYFITDYITKSNALNNIFGLGTGSAIEPAQQANLTYITPLWPEQSGEEWDRQTRQVTNNYNAYLARRQLNAVGPPAPVYQEEEAINQIVTDDYVYDNI